MLRAPAHLAGVAGCQIDAATGDWFDMEINVCPKCAANAGVPIVYGLPGPEMESDASAGRIVFGGCDLEPGQANRACTACGHRWAIPRLHLGPADRVEELGRPFMLWQIGAVEGAFVDWDDWPLVLKFEPAAIAVEAEVGRAGDHGPEDEPLADYVDVALGAVELLYRDDVELAWLRLADRGELHSACEQVAALASAVSQALAVGLDFDPQPASYQELEWRGPFSDVLRS